MAAWLERLMIVWQQFQIHGPIDVNLTGPNDAKRVDLHFMPGAEKLHLAETMAETLGLVSEPDTESEGYLHHHWSGRHDGFEVTLSYLERIPEPEPVETVIRPTDFDAYASDSDSRAEMSSRAASALATGGIPFIYRHGWTDRETLLVSLPGGGTAAIVPAESHYDGSIKKYVGQGTLIKKYVGWFVTHYGPGAILDDRPIGESPAKWVGTSTELVQSVEAMIKGRSIPE